VRSPLALKQRERAGDTAPMRQFSAALFFALGVAAGGMAMSHLWISASRMLYEASLIQFQSEQEYLANRAHRNGDAFRESLHRTNVVDAQTEVGFRWLQRARTTTYREWLTFPWIWVGTKFDPKDPRYEKARRSIEAQYRVQAAIALEGIPLASLAEEQWSRALALQPAWSIERLREYHAGVRTPQWIQESEDAFLDSPTWSELETRQARIREKHALE
jgi:hypothetical protein